MSHGASTTYRGCVEPIKKVDETLFLHKLESITAPVLGENIDETVKQVTDVSYQNAQTSGRESLARERNSDLNRWERLLMENDHFNTWKARNWKGEYEYQKENYLCLSDDKFQEHFERCFNPLKARLHTSDDATDVCIPVLDDVFTKLEVKKTNRFIKIR